MEEWKKCIAIVATVTVFMHIDYCSTLQKMLSNGMFNIITKEIFNKEHCMTRNKIQLLA